MGQGPPGCFLFLFFGDFGWLPSITISSGERMNNEDGYIYDLKTHLAPEIQMKIDGI